MWMRLRVGASAFHVRPHLGVAEKFSLQTRFDGNFGGFARFSFNIQICSCKDEVSVRVVRYRSCKAYDNLARQDQFGIPNSQSTRKAK